jgi:hypothetical protein
MRKPFALLLAAALIVAVGMWAYWAFAVSVVPGWHTPILAPYAVVSIFISAVLLAIAVAILFREIGGTKSSR